MSAPTNIAALGTIMGVWAHPDDETFSAAGVMALAVQNGQKVVCITATKGEQGVQDPDRWPPERLSQIRAAELDAALNVVGVSAHHWLGYQDGACGSVDAHAAIEAIGALMDQYQPDTIMSFGPDGMTGHPDHQATSRWALAAARARNIPVLHAVLTPQMYAEFQKADEKFNIFFNTSSPPIVDTEQCALRVVLDTQTLDIKCQALEAMPSQTEALTTFLGKEGMCKLFAEEAFVRA